MKSFRPMGLFPLKPDLELPSRTGLFGTSLSVASLVLIGDQQTVGFEFKASADCDRERRFELYNYPEDLEYNWAVKPYVQSSQRLQQNNLDFLQYLKRKKLALLPEFLADLWAMNYPMAPLRAPSPSMDQGTAYIWPSYIIWDNDPSYISFLGSPDRLELPKHVLRSTGGHPQQSDGQGRSNRPRPSHRWHI